MRIRNLLWAAPVAGALALGVAADRLLSKQPQDPKPAPAAVADGKPAVKLPVSRVILFNAGVGYFTRSGEVEGDARVDLTFPEADINDLLKSMTLHDRDGGTVSAVSYDSREPIGRTLSSFAINLSSNPTLGQIVGQARGEKVEVVLNPAPNRTLTGTVVGVEVKAEPVANAGVRQVEHLTLMGDDGLRSVPFADVQRVRFLNPALDAEFRRALDVLALSHDARKKAVSLQFTGNGKRRVQVGYVVEAPIWKTSYRLLLDKDGKPRLQGWALVENPTDEDWTDVSMALVSGRPIAFKMDLYNPLYVPRPTVEPELFASLRPPTYQRDLGRDREALADAPATPPGFMPSPAPPAAPKPAANPEDPMGDKLAELQRNAAASGVELDNRRRRAAQLGKELAQRMETGAVQSMATAGQLGDYFEYVIDHPVRLGRQKSAMLPLFTKEVEGSRVSIYNQAVQPRHPLLGLRFKNTTGASLTQGPVSVFEGSNFAGDTRVLDLQPNEERLVSYAVDLGTEVEPQAGPSSSRVTGVKAVKGVVTVSTKVREERRYRIVNKGPQDRTVLIEHPNRTNGGFKLVEPSKPAEETAGFWRFTAVVPAGKNATLTVVEEQDQGTAVYLTNTSDDQIRYYLGLKETSDALKAKLKQAIDLRGKWAAAQREAQQVAADIQRITTDQTRIRQNLQQTPREAEVYGTYLKKLTEQEKEMDALTARQKELAQAEAAAKGEYEAFVQGLSD